MWNLNNIILWYSEMWYSLNFPLADLAVCVSGVNFLSKSKKILVKYQSLLQFSSDILTVGANKLYQNNPHY